jgi:hypothetical protein
MSNLGRYYGRGKKVKLRDGSDRMVGTIEFADHKNDLYHITWKRPGDRRGNMSSHSRLALIPHRG